MATKTFYLTATTSAAGWRTLSETTQAAITNADGWTVSTGATLHAEYQVNVKRASTVFTGTTVPDGTLDTSLKDAFCTDAFTGTFAAGNWTFSFVVRAVTAAGTQNGRIRFRVLQANLDGSGATEITSAQQQGALTGAIANTTADFTSALTASLPAITLANQSLFVQIAWERTAAGGMTTADVSFRTGSASTTGTRIVTTDFVAVPVVGGVTLASGAAVTVPTVAYALTVPGMTLSDSYAFSNISSQTTTAHDQGWGQSFLGDGNDLDSARGFFAPGVGLTGTLTAKVYAAIGTHGTDARPTGPALAESFSLDMSTLVLGLYTFVFSGANRIRLSNGVTYVVTFETSLAGSGNVFVRIDTTSPTHAGNSVAGNDISVYGAPTAWSVNLARDVVFEVWTRPYTQVFAPVVTPVEIPTDQAVTGTTLATGSQTFVPTVVPAAADQVVTATALATGSAVTAPTVTPGAVTITSATRASSTTTFAPTCAAAITTATRASSAAVSVPALAYALTTATRAATSGISAPTLAAALTAATRVSTSTLFAPIVTTAGAVIGGTIAAGSVLFAPALSGLVRARHFGYIMTTT